MAINKVIYGSNTLIDLTGDTVTPNRVLAGTSFHSASGDSSVGELVTRNVKDTTLEDYEDDLSDAENGDLLIITDSDGALGTNVINTTEEDFNDAVDEALEGDFIVNVDENVVEDIDDRLTSISNDIGDVSELPNPLGSISENIADMSSNLTANNQPFRFGYEDGKYGYITKEADTDVFRPFSIMNNRVTLWENPNTSTSFSDQNVSLLSDFHDFELIEFRFLTKAGVSLDGDNVASVYYTPSDIDKFNSIATYKPTFMLSPSFYYTTAVNFRTLIKINNSTINIGNAHRYDGQYTRNDAVIPIGIYGIG